MTESKPTRIGRYSDFIFGLAATLAVAYIIYHMVVLHVLNP